jgi:hypothetical protein
MVYLFFCLFKEMLELHFSSGLVVALLLTAAVGAG